MEISKEVLKKLKIKLPYDPAIPLLGMYELHGSDYPFLPRWEIFCNSLIK
jgi:hypothetical protein